MADVEIGKKFGYWTVIGSVPGRNWKWNCKCVCGNTKVVATIQLARGNSQSCGCKRMQFNLQGKKFGKWTVGEYKQEPRGEDSKYSCICVCGNTRLVRSRDLRNGASTNCGCSARVAEGLVALRAVLTTYKTTAAKRGLDWGLSEEEFMFFLKQNCHYCGRAPFQYRAYGKKAGAYYMGIDRVENDVGYIMGNLVPCCKVCNSAKRCMSQEDFYVWIKMVYKHSASRKRGV